jgi:hypothetical protein
LETLQVSVTKLNTNKTAILIFANSAEQEAFSKPFKSSALLFDALNHQTLQKVEKTGIPYIISSEKEQVGTTFSERFTNAIQSVFDKGYEQIITLGNDTPHLQSCQILQTVEQLKTNDIVLGPSLDGGFYLMGLRKSQFNRNTFLNLPWQTSELIRSISRLITAKKIRLFTLEVLRDIDSVTDVKSILDSAKSLSKTLKTILLSVLSDVKANFIYSVLYIKNTRLLQYFNKGSPELLHI